jgi:hypothetical protein
VVKFLFYESAGRKNIYFPVENIVFAQPAAGGLPIISIQADRKKVF